MTGPRTAVITVVHGRHRHLAHQERALARLSGPAPLRCVVALDDPGVAQVAPSAAMVDCPATPAGLPLARARNLGAQRCLQDGAELLVFLDVDCLPGPDLLDLYRVAHDRVGRALLAGPVTYLSASHQDHPLDRLDDLTDPHPARPSPPRGSVCTADDHDLFWSLSFAVGADTWRELGGFCEDYVGYGGEDTDFAAVARRAGVPLVWVGGAHAYHQYHAVSDPPIEHLTAIVTNAQVFRRRWGRWPMVGWLDEFERRELIRRDGDAIALTGTS